MQGKGFHQWTKGSVTVVLTRSAMHSDFTDIYLHAVLRDCDFKHGFCTAVNFVRHVMLVCWFHRRFIESANCERKTGKHNQSVGKTSAFFLP